MDELSVVSMLQAVLPHVPVEVIRHQVRVHDGDAQAAFDAAAASAAIAPAAVDLEDELAPGPPAVGSEQPAAPQLIVDLDEEADALARSSSDFEQQLAVMRGILPEADEDFLRTSLAGAGGNAERALAGVLEKGDDAYPRRPRPERQASSSSSSALAPAAEGGAAKESEHSFDAGAYASHRKGKSLTAVYMEEAKRQLELEFPEFTVNSVHKAYAKHGSLFTVAWRWLYDATTSLLGKKPLPPPLKVAKKRRKAPLSSEAKKSRRLKAEAEFVHAWRREQEEDASRTAALALYREQCMAEGAVLTCECCCADEIQENMVQCTEGHLFCAECVSRYVSTQLGDGGGESLLRLRCMSTSGCTEELPPSELKRALSPKLLESYLTRMEKASVEHALGGGIEQCPFCDYAMEMELSPEENKIFVCQAEDCGKESCRLCRQEAHLPLRCDEVKNKKVADNHRLSVEERMSCALIRECKPCHQRGITSRFVKESGCNKMTCPKCKGWTCYSCSEPIAKNVGYGHFCQHPTEPGQACTKCKKCSLWSPPDLEVEETERVRAAALAADNEFRQSHESEVSSGVLEDLAIVRESREGNERPKKRPRQGAGRRDAQRQRVE